MHELIPHAERTGSPKAKTILDNWEELLPSSGKWFRFEADSPEANPDAVAEKELSPVH